MEVDYTDISSCELAWKAIKDEIGSISGVKAYFDSTNDYSGLVITVGDDSDGEKQHKLMEAFEKIGLESDRIWLCAGLFEGTITEIGRPDMKEYVSLTIGKLNQLIEQYPDADIKYNSKSLNPSCGCKVLHNDINYDEVDNTIYIG